MAAVSPAVVVPSMLLLQRERYGVEKVCWTLILFSSNLLNIEQDILKDQNRHPLDSDNKTWAMLNSLFGCWRLSLKCMVVPEQRARAQVPLLLSFTKSLKHFLNTTFNLTFFDDVLRCCINLLCVQGIPTLLMAAGSFDDILAITGFSTCLGIAFSTGEFRGTVLIWFPAVHVFMQFVLQVRRG